MVVTFPHPRFLKKKNCSVFCEVVTVGEPTNITYLKQKLRETRSLNIIRALFFPIPIDFLECCQQLKKVQTVLLLLLLCSSHDLLDSLFNSLMDSHARSTWASAECYYQTRELAPSCRGVCLHWSFLSWAEPFFQDRTCIIISSVFFLASIMPPVWNFSSGWNI
jgi:hypothetical protein